MGKYIEISNVNHKMVINSDFDNFVCQSLQVCQVKRMPGVQIAGLPKFTKGHVPAHCAYLSVVQSDVTTVQATVALSPWQFILPPVIAVSLPAGYNYEASFRVQNLGNPTGAQPGYYYLIQIHKNDASAITVAEIGTKVDVYVYDFLYHPVAGYTGNMLLERTNPIGRGRTWRPTIPIYADEGAGATRFGENPRDTMEYPIPLYKRERDKYPGINDCKIGLQVFGYHRFWKEKYHSPKRDPRTPEEKKKKKNPQYAPDLLFDSRLPYMYIISAVTKDMSPYIGSYRKGDIYKLHQDGTTYPAEKVAVCISSTIDGTAVDVEPAQHGFPEYFCRQLVAFYGPSSVGTMEVQRDTNLVTSYPGGFYGSTVTNYLIINVDGVTPNTVDEFE